MMRRRGSLLWLAALTLAALTACGQTGPLTLPERGAAAELEEQAEDEREDEAGPGDEQ